ncbi:OLC1v1024313C2 [Oldenlandia corymbosa var. corymbosa]|uniref:OLC1v1024313C2 n=1 Tax=Oldenlandia corymbosa var. corymbosa TaxID=529605 RepID=A0AAV1C4V2_OLDCO|nr:OLC1v1024313C2 [Oldenlandia corymbosa var. corymbosa]
MATARFCLSMHSIHRSFLRFSSVPGVFSPDSLEESIKAAVEARNYAEIPDLLTGSQMSCPKSNPFSFLTRFPIKQRTTIVDDILESLVSQRPRSRPHIAYSCLLMYTLQSLDPLPLAFAVLQRMLRSGCLPVPETHLLLSTAWLQCRSQSQSVSNILLEMQNIGYNPDSGICNYLILSLCRADQLKEAFKVLKGMGRAGCVPDLDTYGTLIAAMADLKMTSNVVELMKEMVGTFGLCPRQQLLVKVTRLFRANKEFQRAIEMIEYLESKDVHVGFDVYELVLEGCLDGREFVLAGKLVMSMTGKGYIPYITVRQRVVEGLYSINEMELASAENGHWIDQSVEGDNLQEGAFVSEQAGEDHELGEPADDISLENNPEAVDIMEIAEGNGGCSQQLETLHNPAVSSTGPLDDPFGFSNFVTILSPKEEEEFIRPAAVPLPEVPNSIQVRTRSLNDVYPDEFLGVLVDDGVHGVVQFSPPTEPTAVDKEDLEELDGFNILKEEKNYVNVAEFPMIQQINQEPACRQIEVIPEAGQTDEANAKNEHSNGNGVDPTFLEALPEDLRAEVLASHYHKVLAQQQVQRIAQQAAGQPVEMDNASIPATFPADLREEVLLTSSEAVLSALPSPLLAETQMLRDRTMNDQARSLFGSSHRFHP